MEGLIEYLKNNSLFDGIPEDELGLITEQFQRITFAKGDSVFKEGDAGQSMFLLVEGQAFVLKDFFGGDRSLGVIHPGNYFGEMSLLSGNNRSATVQAHTDLVCYTINQPDFMALVEKNHRLSLNMIQTLNDRLIHSENKANQQIINAYHTMIFSLADLAESRDPEIGEHLMRVQAYCMFIAERVMTQKTYPEPITYDFIENIYNVSPLHDIGKVGIPDRILLKPGELAKDEFEKMKTHTIIGAHTLKKVLEQVQHPTFVMAYNLVRHHHERYDGSGYPDGLSGDHIPFESRIIAIADVFDALMSRRCYKEPFDIDTALQIIKKESGGRFDPELVNIMMDNVETFKTIHHRYKDNNAVAH